MPRSHPISTPQDLAALVFQNQCRAPTSSTTTPATLGQKAPNRRIVIGRHGPVTSDQARRPAREFLGRVALGGDPLQERARSHAMPTLRQAFKDYLAVVPRRKHSTIESYRRAMEMDLGDSG